MVLYGSDYLILDSETAIGKHPLKALEALAKSIAEAEAVYDYDQAFSIDMAEAVAYMRDSDGKK